RKIRSVSFAVKQFSTHRRAASLLLQRVPNKVSARPTECAALQGPALFRLNVCRANDLAPLVDTFGDELAEIIGAHWHRHATEIGEPRLDLGIGKSSIDLLVEFVDDLRRCILWRADAAP